MKKNSKGFSLVELLIVVAIIGIIAAIAIPSLLAARRASNESAAQGNLRTIGSGEATYIAAFGGPGDFTQMTAARMLDGEWTSGVTRDSYVITEVGVDFGGGTFEFSATPTNLSNGTKSYNIVEDYVIRFLAGTTAPTGTAGSAIGVN